MKFLSIPSREAPKNTDIKALTEGEDLVDANSNIIYSLLQSPDHLVRGVIAILRVVIYLIGGMIRLQ